MTTLSLTAPSRLWTDAPVFTGLALFLTLSILPVALALHLDPRQWLGEAIWLKPLKFQIARVRQLQAEAAPGIDLLHATSRPCIRAASELYCGIVDEVEAIGYDIFNKRAKTSTARRIRVAGKAYLQALSARRALN